MLWHGKWQVLPNSMMIEVEEDEAEDVEVIEVDEGEAIVID